MATEKGSPRRTLLLSIALAVLALIVAGCGLAPTTAPRASNQWSNGRLLGTAVLNNQLGFQVDGRGNSTVVWIGLEHELHLARVDERAEVVSHRTLDLPTNSPLRPQLMADATGQLHLSWLDKEDRGLRLYYARLSADGEVAQGPTALSSLEERASQSSMVLDPIGRTLELFWSDNTPNNPGCYHAALDWSGEVVAPAEMLIPDGISPAAQMDRQGFVHLVWREEPASEKPEFHYAIYDPQRRTLGPDIMASEPLIQMGLLGGPTAGTAFDGPWLGLDQSSVYLAWTLEVRERGQVKDLTFYQAFPQPALNERNLAEAFYYQPPIVTSPAIHVQGVDPSLTGHPRFLEGQPAHQVLASYTLVSGPGNLETYQIAAIEVGPERVERQEIVSASRGASLRPSVAIDDQGYLHLVWIDTAGFQRYQVVYASNAPQAKQTLNRITPYDVVDRVLTTTVRVLSAMFFAPVALTWMLVPLVWLIVFTVRSEAEVSDPSGRRSLVLAMLLHLGIKLFFFGDLLTRLTFGSLLSPSSDALLGRWILPIIMAAASAGVVWVYLKRARSQPVLLSYVIFGVIDSILTLVIYVTAPLS